MFQEGGVANAEAAPRNEEEDEVADASRGKWARKPKNKKYGKLLDNCSVSIKEFNVLARARVGGCTCYVLQDEHQL